MFINRRRADDEHNMSLPVRLVQPAGLERRKPIPLTRESRENVSPTTPPRERRAPGARSSAAQVANHDATDTTKPLHTTMVSVDGENSEELVLGGRVIGCLGGPLSSRRGETRRPAANQRVSPTDPAQDDNDDELVLDDVNDDDARPGHGNP